MALLVTGWLGDILEARSLCWLAPALPSAVSQAQMLLMLGSIGVDRSNDLIEGRQSDANDSGLTSPRSLQCNSHFTAARKN